MPMGSIPHRSPSTIVIWRNFPYPRFQRAVRGCTGSPIGPRAEFLDPGVRIGRGCRPGLRIARSPGLSWARCGRSGSRTLAASLFLRALPQGVSLVERASDMGLSLLSSYQGLSACYEAHFALCPEGDRHLDTFRSVREPAGRLYSCGC